jgi:glycerol uptake facilitator-like aquaporin
VIENSLRRRVFAEWFGTAALLAIVVGSGQMGEALSPGNTAVALLANSIATALGLWVLIELLAPVSGAHFNPIVSATFALRRELPVRDACAYIVAQFAGAICGVWLAHLMFDLSIYQTGEKVRVGLGQFTSETTASVGLIVTILVGRVSRPSLVPAMVAAYIGSAYWFTASTSFANPAVTVARAFTTTFAGIRLTDVPLFLAGQVTGALLAFGIAFALLNPKSDH